MSGRDDVAKIAHFFNEERGRGLLDESLLDSAMFRTTRGVTMPNGAGERLYSKGFWAIDVSIPGCASPVLVPFWSGFGGISVALFPNGLNYFYFSDNYEYAEFTKEAVEVHKILPLC